MHNIYVVLFVIGILLCSDGVHPDNDKKYLKYIFNVLLDTWILKLLYVVIH